MDRKRKIQFIDVYSIHNGSITKKEGKYNSIFIKRRRAKLGMRNLLEKIDDFRRRDLFCRYFFGAHRESFHRPLTSNGKGPKMGDYKTPTAQLQVQTGDTQNRKMIWLIDEGDSFTFFATRKPKEKKIKEIRTEINYRMQKFVVKEKSLNPSNLISLTSISFPLLPFVIAERAIRFYE